MVLRRGGWGRFSSRRRWGREFGDGGDWDFETGGRLG